MFWNGVFPAGSERQTWQELIGNVRVEGFGNENLMLSDGTSLEWVLLPWRGEEPLALHPS